MAEPTIVPRSAAHDLAPRHRSRRPQSSVPAPRASLHRVSGRRQRPRPAARIAGRRTSTSARRRIRIRSRSSFGTAGSSAGASASRTSSSGHKTIEVATFRRQVDPTELTAEAEIAEALEAAPKRPVDRSTPDSTRQSGRYAEEARRASATAARERSADSSRQHLRHAGRGRVPARLHRQRALLRHRHLLDHRLRRRPRGSRARG